MIPGAAKRVLSCGDLAFTAYEMGRGPLVLCLHGFPDTPKTWQHLLPDLAQRGFRAVAVTSRGYEAGSRPADGDYSLAALSGDVLAWMDALGEQRAHLIGHDWGSSIMHLAAAAAPQRALSLTALAVPHPTAFAERVMGDMAQLARSWYVFFLQIPGLGEAAMQGDFLARLWRAWSPGLESGPALVAAQSVFADPAARAAAIAYYRTGFDAGHPRLPETLRLQALPILTPTLALCGAQDGCVGADVFEASLASGVYRDVVTARTLPGTGHFLHLERPAEVASHVCRFLANPRAA